MLRAKWMGRGVGVTGLAGVVASLMLAGGAGAQTGAGSGAAPSFGPDSAKITNRYLPISKFDRCVLKGEDAGKRLVIVRTLESSTKSFDYQGQTVQAAVVHDHVTNVGTGQTIEKTVDYFAQDSAGTVYYFGEDVNDYRNGHLTGHPGQWRLGRDTETPGVLMPAHPKVGDKFQSEAVPGVAEETDRVIDSNGTARIGGHIYHHVLKIHENASPDHEIETKQYSPDTGVITEASGGVKLAHCS